MKAVEGSTTTYFVYSGLSLVHTVSGSSATRYVYAAGLLVARVAGTATSYVHQDALGSTRAVSDGCGNWAYVTQYESFGKEYGTQGSWASPKYTAQWRDGSLGLYYLYRRFYDPDLGRFLSQDPILGHLTVPQSLDRYTYTVNNPLRYVDPTGESWWNPFDWGAGALQFYIELGKSVGQALSKINPLDLLDAAMTVLGFIPGLDIISDAYFLGRALIDVALGRGSWADVAMNAAALLLPVGSVLRASSGDDSDGDSWPRPPALGPPVPRRASPFNAASRYRGAMEYRIVLRKGQDGYYVAQCLEVPGAISQGRTKEEALRNAKEALELILEVLKAEARKGRDRPGEGECLSCRGERAAGGQGALED